MYAINQSKFRESKTFSSLHNLENLFSSKGLVKILANWFLLLIWQTSIFPFAGGLSKSMLDVYVLSAAVFNRIIRQVDCTLIITYEWDFAQIIAKVPEGLPHPK
jgi:hypothetical protein